MSTSSMASVNSVRSQVIYHLGNYTGDNVASQAQAPAVLSRPFRWADLGFELYDIEMEGAAVDG